MFKLLNTRDITDAGLESQSNNVNGDIRLESEVKLDVFATCSYNSLDSQPWMLLTLFLTRASSSSSRVGLWAERFCLGGPVPR